MKTPKFERRHYRAVANVIASIPARDPEPQIDCLIDRFVELFRADNSNFEPKRFRDACAGVPRYEITTEGKKALLKGAA